jgi:hypothetical protein
MWMRDVRLAERLDKSPVIKGGAPPLARDAGLEKRE